MGFKWGRQTITSSASTSGASDHSAGWFAAEALAAGDSSTVRSSTPSLVRFTPTTDSMHDSPTNSLNGSAMCDREVDESISSSTVPQPGGNGQHNPVFSQFYSTATLNCSTVDQSMAHWPPMPPAEPRLYLEETHIFREPRKGVAGDFCANSYIGWHSVKRMASAQHAYNEYANGLSLATPGMSPNASGSLSVALQPPDVLTHHKQRSRTGSCMSGKCKLGLLLLVLLIITCVLIALAVALVTQVRSHSSMMRLVRQYEGQMLIVDGRLLQLDPQVLDSQSQAFKQLAQQYEQMLDNLLQPSAIGQSYESAQVTQFRLLAEVPALEVLFRIKTNIAATFDASEVLSALYEGIQQRLLPDHAVVDMNTLSIENQRLNDRQRISRPPAPIR